MAAHPPFKTGPGTALDGRFEILQTLGNGAMSVVVAARHLQLRQKVAIKLLRPEYAANPDVVTRFLREARAAACLRNEHVVSVTDVGTLPTGVPYLIMEYLEGTDLAAHLAARGALPVDQAVHYVLQVLEALAEAHRAGIVHRDLKPANLLLSTREDGSPLIKVLDFGVSKLLGPEHTAHGLTAHAMPLGSPAYMSPEQIRDASDVDVRTDIWSVGVLMYELVTGRLPFAGKTAAELMSSICAPQPTPITGLVAHAPIELVGVIGRCVAKDRENRYATVQDLARALRPFVKSASAQVSLDRILCIRSAPTAALHARAEDVRLPSDRPSIERSAFRSTMQTRERRGLGQRNVVAAGLGVLTACVIGSAVAFGGGSREPAPAPVAATAAPAPMPAEICPAPQAVLPAAPALTTPPAQVASLMTPSSSRGGARPRRGGGDAVLDLDPPAATPAMTPAAPAPQGFRARPLDAKNPYERGKRND